jgi:hypothetical protein
MLTSRGPMHRLASRKGDEIVDAPSRCGASATFAAGSCGCFDDALTDHSLWYASYLRYAALVAVLVACCVRVNGAMQAREKHTIFGPKPVDIHVQANGFGRASLADITAALQSAAFEIWRHCPHTRLDGIDFCYRPDHPQTNFERTSNGRIGIGLSARDTHWAQYSFQFAHEFCHALANYSNNSQRMVRYPRHANLWLEESPCETASLFALRAMSRSWLTALVIRAGRVMLRGSTIMPSGDSRYRNIISRPERRF